MRIQLIKELINIFDIKTENKREKTKSSTNVVKILDQIISYFGSIFEWITQPIHFTSFFLCISRKNGEHRSLAFDLGCEKLVGWQHVTHSNQSSINM
jgi:hypothetical protein